MTMAPLPPLAKEAIRKAAELPSVAHGGTWDGLKVFLELNGLDPEDIRPGAPKPKDWMEALDEQRSRNIAKVKSQSSHPSPPRSAWGEFGDLPDFFRDKVRHVVLGSRRRVANSCS